MGIGLSSRTATSAARPISGVLACGDCDRLHYAPVEIAEIDCVRCRGQLADGGNNSYAAALALALTGIFLLLLVCTQPLMTTSEQGATRVDFLISGAVTLGEQGFWPLTAAVLFFSVLAPVMRLLCLGYVLLGLYTGRRFVHAAWAMKTVSILTSWAMLDVFLIGGLVAYSRVQAIVPVVIGPGGYALIAFLIVSLALDDVLASQLVWRHLGSVGETAIPEPVPTNQRATCLVCGLVMAPDATDGGIACIRCGTALSRRKKDSINRTWALIAAALILYIPANLLPVMVVVRFGHVESDTIYSGVKVLIEAQMWPLAAIVFLASIAVPVLKLGSLTLLLLSIHFRWQARLHDRTRLYRLIEVIGRWSNIDVFTVSILAALVQFGTLTTVRAGPGMVPFALVVLLTMFASRSFDPRLMWDNAEPVTPT